MFFALLFISMIIAVSFASPVSVTTVTSQTNYGTITNMYYETISGPASSTPSTNTALIPSSSSGSYSIAQASTAYLWSPQFGSATTISAGTWLLGLWAASVSNIVSYIPITITNSQSSATPSTFQEKITWNPSSYTSYEASDLGNIRFYSDSNLAIPIYAWLESCTPSLSNTATSATAWVKLTSSIAQSGGTTTIYMAFLSTNTDFDGNYWGTAPTLSPTYSQYDDGSNVFIFYDNFAGTTLSSAWNTTGAAGTLSVNNGLIVNSSPFPGYAFTLNNQYTGPLIIDAYQVGTYGDWLGASFSNLQTTSTSYTVTSGAVQWVYPPEGADGINGLCIASGSTAFTPNPSATTLQVVTLAVNSTTATEYQNYASPVTASGTISLTNYPGLVQVAYSSSDTQTTYWFRLRAYPPNNVMPSVSFGSVFSEVNALSVSIYVTDSSGNIQSIVASNIQSPAIGSSVGQYVMRFAGSQVAVPQNGYITIMLSTTQTTSYTVYWGKGQPTNFQMPYRVLTS